jgi:hypothetical protein
VSTSGTATALAKAAGERVLAVVGRHPHGHRLTSALLWDRGLSIQPSEIAKRRYLRQLFRVRGHRVFIESGTYEGDTVAFFDRAADTIWSVELDDALYGRSSARFAGWPHITIVHGDATKELPPAVAAVASPPLIYLDAHFSHGISAQGDEIEPAPTMLPLVAAAAPAGTTVVIDDLRLFGREPTYPQLDVLLAAARAAFPDATIYAGLDSLVIET